MTLREKALWLILGLWAVAMLWPASFWYSPGHLRVPDFRQGQKPVEILYDGQVHREFFGSYTVIARNVAGAIVVEDRSEPFTYRPGVPRPSPLTLAWWSEGRADDIRNLAPGQYTLETCWTIRAWHGVSLYPAKYTCTAPAIFRILPQEGGGR